MSRSWIAALIGVAVLLAALRAIAQPDLVRGDAPRRELDYLQMRAALMMPGGYRLEPGQAHFVLADAGPCWVGHYVVGEPGRTARDLVTGALGRTPDGGTGRTFLVAREGLLPAVREHLKEVLQSERTSRQSIALPEPVFKHATSPRAAVGDLCRRNWPAVPVTVMESAQPQRLVQRPGVVSVVNCSLPVLVDSRASEMGAVVARHPWQIREPFKWNALNSLKQLPVPQGVPGERALLNSPGPTMNAAGVILPDDLEGFAVRVRPPREPLAVRFLLRCIQEKDMLVPAPLVAAGKWHGFRSEQRIGRPGISGLLGGDGGGLLGLTRDREATVDDGKWHTIELLGPAGAQEGAGGRFWVDGRPQEQVVGRAAMADGEGLIRFTCDSPGGLWLVGAFQTNAEILPCETFTGTYGQERPQRGKPK